MKVIPTQLARSIILCVVVSFLSGGELEQIVQRYKKDADKIISTCLKSDESFDRLAYVCDTFGPRLSGSRNLENAIDWILAEMASDGLENVHGEPLMVPRWVRGDESARLLEPYEKNLTMLGLGGSVATPVEGIEAELLVVSSFEELEERGKEAGGKIVLFDVPFTTYGETVKYRYGGATAAAKHGAVASLIRSVGPYSMNTAHTGGMGYLDGVPKIPHAAITMEDAAMLHRLQEYGERIVVRLKMEAHFEEDSPSRNVIAELRGSEKPEEVVVIGGHIDSWDVGQGAHDDGGGCVASWEAVRILKEMGFRPRRTIRVVLWTNEENGGRGSKAYRDAHKDELDKHILAIESDHGVFRPTGFGFTGSELAMSAHREIAKLLESIGADSVIEGGIEADTGPLEEYGVPVMSLEVDGSRYFWYHHTHADAIDKVNPEEFKRCIATLAVMAYVAADFPDGYLR